MHAESMVTAIKEDKGIGRNVMTKGTQRRRRRMRRLHGTSEHHVYWSGSMGSTHALVAAVFSGWKSKSRYAATD